MAHTIKAVYPEPHHHMNILTANNLAKSFGRVQAVARVSFDVQQGEILGVLGPNGAGKTSVFNLLTGVLKPDSGDIIFNGRNITKKSPSSRCRMGIGRTYQIPRPFGNMTVFENLLVGAAYGGGFSEKSSRSRAAEILETVGLYNKGNDFARTLRLLDRKRLELARALSTNPSLLLLDEIAAGLTESEVEVVLNIVRNVREAGITVVWIEHILMMMSRGVDRILVLAEGKNLLCGDPASVMSSEEVMECYLGTEENK